MSPHDRIEVVHTMAETMAQVDTVEVPFIELPEVERPEELSITNIADGEEGEIREVMDEYMDEKTFEITDDNLDEIDIDGISEWWDAWCEVREILAEAFDGDVEGGDSATLTEEEPRDSMFVQNEFLNFSVDIYAGGDVAYISEYAIDATSDSWGVLYEGFRDVDSYDQITLGREVARAELAIIVNTTKSAADTLDYWQTELEPTGWNQKGWADIRGVSRQTVNDRVRSAVDSVGE